MMSLSNVSMTLGMCAVACSTIAATKQPASEPPTTLYSLTADAAYVWGCFPTQPFPCGGAIFFADNFSGPMGLTPAGTDEQGFEVYELSNISWIVNINEPILIMGEGIYRYRGGADPLQEMVLFVELNGEPFTFESGIVPANPMVAGINVTVSMNNFQNYDTQMIIAAAPTHSLFRASRYTGLSSEGGVIFAPGPPPIEDPYPGPQPETE